MHVEFSTVAILVVCAVAFIAANFWESPRHRRRRKSLRQDANGTWVWIGFDGQEQSADIHPAEPGGAWYSEGSGDSGFDGGDGGGGGGE